MGLFLLFYRILPWLPAAVSGYLLYVLWEDLDRPLLNLVWFAVALLLQTTCGIFSPLWFVGFLAQISLAVRLSFLKKMLS
jgi:hypothetical protein